MFFAVDGTNAEHPVAHWIFWDYLRLWLWQLLFSGACLSFGHMMLVRALPAAVPMLERLVLSMGAGVVAFVLFMVLGGGLGIYNSWFAVLLPLFMVSVGYRGIRPAFQSMRREMYITPLRLIVGAFGVVGLVLVYAQAATPDSLAYDARWSHLTIAQDFAREGRIVPFPAATPKNLTHLSSFLYTWSFLLPGFDHQALHWMAAQHLELSLFVWTLAGVSAMAAWVVPQGRIFGSWAAFFLFPGFYVYDSNLGAAADHVAAYFAPPFFLASVRAASRLSKRYVGLAGVFAGALLHTKFQCLYLVTPVALLLSVRFIWLGVVWVKGVAEAAAELRSNLAFSPALFIGGTLLSFGPHLLTNTIFYHNPVYPLLLDLFPSVPMIEGFPHDPMVQATAAESVIERIKNAGKLMFSFSFDPQPTPLGKAPYFGSMFTILSPVVLLFPRNRRLWISLFLAQGALFMWGFVYRLDRNLQLLLPWLVAYTAAALRLLWNDGRLSQIAATLLVGLQLAWGSKFMIVGGQERIDQFFQLIRSDVASGEKTGRYDRYLRPYRLIGEALPKDAVVLLHTAHLHLGIDRTTLSDWAGWQYLIDYRAMKTPRDVYDRYRELGITHIVWNNHDFPSIKQEDVLFFAFTNRYALRVPNKSGYSIWEMPKEAPPREEPWQVVAMGLNGYRDGLFSIEALNVVEDLPADKKKFPAPEVTFDPVSPDPNLAKNRSTLVVSSLKRADAVLLAGGYALAAPERAEISRCFTRYHSYYAGYFISSYAVYLKKERPGCSKP